MRAEMPTRSRSKSKYLLWKNEKGNDMKQSGSCRFCNDLETMKRVAKANEKSGFSSEYRAALIISVSRYGEHCGTSTYHEYKLNYCPVCGKEIKDE